MTGPTSRPPLRARSGPPRWRPRTWVSESPLVLGIAVGLGALWWRGHAFVLDRDLRGYHWPEYLVQAWRIHLGTFDTAAGFRKPLYPALLQTLGTHLSYADAAVLLGSLSAALCVVSAGLLARALADAPAGGLAALSLGLVPLVANSSHWATSYPLSAASVGVGLAASAIFARWPRTSTAVLPALGAGLALAVDDRGALVLPMAGVCALIGTQRGRGGARLALPLLLLVPVLPAVVAQGLGYAPEPLSQLGGRVDAQRAVAARWATISQHMDLVEGCSPTPVRAWMRTSFLTSACGKAVFADNWTWVLPRGLTVPLLWPAVAAMGWLAGRRGSETAPTSLILLGALVAPVLLFALLTPLPTRYLLQVVVPLGVVLPVGLARVGGRLPRPLWWTLALAAAGALMATAPSMGDGSDWASTGQWSPDTWVDEHDALRAVLAPDEVVLDCSDHSATVALLPQHAVPETDLLEVDIVQCRAWARGTAVMPPGAWLLTDPKTGLGVPDQHRRVPMHTLVDDRRWVPRVERRSFVAWQWSGRQTGQ